MPAKKGVKKDETAVEETKVEETKAEETAEEPKVDETDENTTTETPKADDKADETKDADIIETVEFKFNKFVNLGGVLIKAGETVEVTLEEAEEFTKAKHGEIVK